MGDLDNRIAGHTTVPSGDVLDEPPFTVLTDSQVIRSSLIYRKIKVQCASSLRRKAPAVIQSYELAT